MLLQADRKFLSRYNNLTSLERRTRLKTLPTEERVLGLISFAAILGYKRAL